MAGGLSDDPEEWEAGTWVSKGLRLYRTESPVSEPTGAIGLPSRGMGWGSQGGALSSGPSAAPAGTPS